MVKKHMKSADGLYHIKSHKYPVLEGSRAQVWHQTAYKTAGNLKKGDLMMNKHGRIVSMAKHKTAKKEKRLEKAGFFTKKGKFGYVKKSVKKGGYKHKTAKKGKSKSKSKKH